MGGISNQGTVVAGEAAESEAWSRSGGNLQRKRKSLSSWWKQQTKRIRRTDMLELLSVLRETELVVNNLVGESRWWNQQWRSESRV